NDEAVSSLWPKGYHVYGCPIHEETDISFLLYTSFSPKIPRRLFLEDDMSVLASLFRENNPTVVYIHGFSETATGVGGQSIKD
ncbi:hypothetical protein L9F63_020765, partial [Diploptera punctata]